MSVSHSLLPQVMNDIYTRLNQYDRMKLQQEVEKEDWKYAISTNMRDPTIAAIWDLHAVCMDCLKEYDPQTKYWLTVAVSPAGKAHGHGCLTTTALKKDINRCFKGANKPILKPLYAKTRWIDYVLQQSLKNTITTNMNEVKQ